jgi:nucleoside-diphosphate-sugar epimerase
LKRCLITGSSGLIGSEVAVYFSNLGFQIHGVDNNQRAVFFGPQGDTRWNQQRLADELSGYQHHELDIRDRVGVLALLRSVRPDVVVHAAAQPSHDRAAAIPFDDFDTNAVGTLNMLEGARQACPESPFIHMSTNKVYGDAPNLIAMNELPTRWDYSDPAYEHGIPETFSIDQSKHSLFGASKVAADVVVQEYGRYFGLPTCCLRGGCLTGAEPFRRRAARLSIVPREMQSRGTRVPHLRLQGQTGARQYPLARRRAVHGSVLQRTARRVRFTTSAAASRTPAQFSRRSPSRNGSVASRRCLPT